MVKTLVDELGHNRFEYQYENKYANFNSYGVVWFVW